LILRCVGTDVASAFDVVAPVDAASGAPRGQRLEQVRLLSRSATDLPRELSGGEKQRIAIGPGLSLRAGVGAVRRRPLSSCDVSVQSAICQLLLDLQHEGRASYVFVSHDLAIVRYMADRIAVMYLGEVIEEGSAESFDHRPVHPYTEALFPPLSQPDPMVISQACPFWSDRFPRPDKLRPGCIFSPRCHRHKRCRMRRYEDRLAGRARARYRCHWSPAELLALQATVSHPWRRRHSVGTMKWHT